MAILTKPTITKGQANEFDLSKSDLAAVSKVVNDSYFSDQTNWSKVIVEYKSAEGNQHEMVIFDASEASPKGNFEVSEKAKDSLEVQSVIIMDFDGGYLKLQRGDLTVEDFDIVLSSSTSSTSLTSLTWFNLPATMDDSVADSLSGTASSEFKSNEFIDPNGNGFYEFTLENSVLENYTIITIGDGFGAGLAFESGGGVYIYGDYSFRADAGSHTPGDTYKIEHNASASTWGSVIVYRNNVQIGTYDMSYQVSFVNKYFQVLVQSTNPDNGVTISDIGLQIL